VTQVIDRVDTDLSERKDFRRFSSFALDWFGRIAESSAQKGDDAVVERFARYGEERQVWMDLTRQIFETLGSNCSLEAFLQELQLRSKEPTPAPGTIVLMTIHSSKG